MQNNTNINFLDEVAQYGYNDIYLAQTFNFWELKQRGDSMKKILLAIIFCMNISFGGVEVLGESLYKDVDGSKTRTKALENQHFTYELKVDALKNGISLLY